MHHTNTHVSGDLIEVDWVDAPNETVVFVRFTHEDEDGYPDECQVLSLHGLDDIELDRTRRLDVNVFVNAGKLIGQGLSACG